MIEKRDRETYCVMSGVTGEVQAEALRLWDLFESEYETRQVRASGGPHITYQSGTTEYMDHFDVFLKQMCGFVKPFNITIEGLGYWDTPARTVYLRVTPTEELLRVNRIVNEAVRRMCEGLREEYLPKNWVPHVTIATGDVSEEAFDKIRRDLASYDFKGGQHVAGVDLVRYDPGKDRVETVRHYPFTG